MKKVVLLMFLLIFFSGSSYAQNSNTNIKVGSVFIIAEVTNNNYTHINFPKANLILKKGGIANYETIKGEKVEVTSIKENAKGTLIATIKLTSKRYFFNSHKYVTVAINEAIANKELLKI